MFQIIKNLSHLIALFLTGLILVLGLNTAAFGFLDSKLTNQSPTQLLLQQGIELYQAGKYTSAIPLFQQALQQTTQSQDRAAILSNLAQVYRQIGKLDAAIPLWEQAIEIYRSQNDAESQHRLAQVLTEQAQAYSYLGQNQRALPLLKESLSIIEKYPDRTIELIVQGALGDVDRSLGDYDNALIANQKSVEIAKSLNNPEYLTMALTNLGNFYVSQIEHLSNQLSTAKSEKNKHTQDLQSQINLNIDNAKKNYEQSVDESKKIGGLPEVKGLLNLNNFLVSEENLRTSETERIANNSNRLLELLAVIPDSRDKAYALIKVAQQQLKLQNIQPEKALSKTQIQPIIAILEQAITVTRNIDDSLAESFAVGKLGYMYELAQEYPKAMELTRQAEFAAQKVNAADSLYLWYWQAGRILNATGEKKQALATYSQAYRILQNIRGDLVASGKELQFNFRDEVEPVYRELIGLLLEESTQTNNQLKEQTVQTAFTKQAIDVLETLKLAELQNYFGEECLQLTQNNSYSNATNINLKTAIIYSVILKNRTAMVMQLPNQTLKIYPISIGDRELETKIDKLRELLYDQRSEDYFELSKEIYNLLIRPLEADLAAAKPETLVFIQDGVLRKVPMSALTDGKQFLIEKYPIATTPSISLTNYTPILNKNLQALVVGLSVAHAPFPALPNVKNEVKRVQKILSGTTLVDKDFTLDNFINKLETESYQIVHIATHGTFGIDDASTFMVSFDNNITIKKIDEALRKRQERQPVELLTMSACETAAGDNRSALGIAGVVVRAGVKSALATLWNINDAATVPLIEEFYTQLRQPNITKAEALRRAQIKLINDPSTSHPALWSPFILIGNWL